MNKLGFAIKLASNGVSMPIVCNKDQWANKVVDIRDFLKLCTGLAYNEQGHQVSTGNSVTFMSFDEGGCFLVLFRAISGRMGDFLSGWIYIPNTIEATGEDIINTYNYVCKILSQSNLSEYRNDIEDFFSKEYPSKEYPAQYTPSKGQLFGIRYLGHYSLKEIVGKHRYQPYYSRYKAIFLLEKDGEVKVAKDARNNFENLTSAEIVKSAVLVPPTSASLQTLGLGTKIYTKDGSEFNQPLLVNLGAKVSLLLSREGFENIKIEVPVASERQVVDFSNTKIIWRRKISSSMFSIRNSKNEKIEKGVRILVNGTDVTFRDALFTEEECRQANLKITAPDYETFEQIQSLLIQSNKITLNRMIKSFQADVELINGEHGEMTIKSKYLPSTNHSPLKGYTFAEDFQGNKILRMSELFLWKQRFWGFFAALVAVMLIITYTAFDTWTDTHHFKFGLPPWEEDRPAQQYNPSDSIEVEDSIQNQGESDLPDKADVTLDAAIKYLDGNSTWSKSELEKYPDLKGLFDDMNQFNLDNIISYWANKLSASTMFKKVCESAKKTQDNAWEPKQDPHKPTYNKSNDELISLTNYIYWLDQDQSPKKTNNNGGFHPNVGSNDKKNGDKHGTNSSNKSGASKETIKNGGL